MTPEQKQLIDERGLIVLPDTIEPELFELFVYAMHIRESKPITVYCRSDGGDARTGEAVAELIRLHGDVTGIIHGACLSAAVTIFAACQRRFACEFAWLGLHTGAFGSDGYRMDEPELDALKKEIAKSDRMQAKLLQRASNASFDLWLGKIQSANHRAVIMVESDDLFLYELAKPIKEWQP